ncbi:MAG: class I SAM-dependent methyltransferase [Chloroflexi bacterium]|nr:class I SAM-dependent methyltransferase [Chloroflexota bacterium]
MMTTQRIHLYEQTALFDGVGEAIRPGGMALTDHALSLCDLPVGARLLDVGCGSGSALAYLIEHYDFEVLGCDPSAQLLHIAHHRGVRSVVQATGEHLPFADGQVDAVLTECSLSVMQNVDLALQEFARILRPSGYLILNDFYARNPAGTVALRCLPVDSCLGGALPQADVIQRVEQHGFEVRAWEDHTDALRIFTAQLIWQHGSMQQFWCRASSHADPLQVQAAMIQAKPGYFLLIAQKGGHNG